MNFGEELAAGSTSREMTQHSQKSSKVSEKLNSFADVLAAGATMKSPRSSKSTSSTGDISMGTTVGSSMKKSDADSFIGTQGPAPSQDPRWYAYVDKESGKKYYFNSETQESRWDMPGTTLATKTLDESEDIEANCSGAVEGATNEDNHKTTIGVKDEEAFPGRDIPLTTSARISQEETSDQRKDKEGRKKGEKIDLGQHHDGKQDERDGSEEGSEEEEGSEDDYENMDIDWQEGSVICPSLSFDDIEVCGTLGHGAFSSVVLVRYPLADNVRAGSTNRPPLVLDEYCYAAAKLMQRSYIVDNGWEEMVENELAAMKEIALQSSFLVRPHNCFCDKFFLYLVVDFCAGGELYNYLQSQEDAHISEDECRFFTACVTLGLCELHAHCIVFRDLKPENLLIDDNGYLLIADFGLAKKTKRTFTVCGTPEYMAPEIILSTGHNRCADQWALGVIIFEMLTGHTPFAGGNHMETYEQIVQHGSESLLPWHVYSGGEFSYEAVDIAEGLIVKRRQLRLGAGDNHASSLRSHAFFQSISFPELEEKTMPSPCKHEPFRVPTDESGAFKKLSEKRQSDVARDLSTWNPIGFSGVS